MLQALILAIRQLPDPAFRAPLLRAAAIAAAAFALLVWLGARAGSWLAAGAPAWLEGRTLEGLAEAVGGLLAVLLAWWLFVPVVVALAGALAEPVAAAVERRHFPALPPARGAGVAASVRWSLGFAARLLLVQLLVLPLALLLPGLGWVLGLLVAGWGLGAGLFEGVAQRRMSVAEARALRKRRQGSVLALGILGAAAASVPLLNLLVPVLGSAAATQLLHRSTSGRLAESRG
jgi:uncharacterized protein involved in cysteine biosynthesis